MGTRYFLVGFLILLVLGFAGPSATLTHSPPAEAQGAHVPQQDEASSPALLTKMQKSLLGYWDTAKAAAHKLYKKTYLPTVDEKIRDIYSKSTAAVTTYAGIITDQVFSILSGED
ncbi:PREDICTED: apolipoprotein C-II isoform X1 [Capra hircus]|uniref:apolipoprotein C-II isoform X1 n=1 Tax=Capra hircus TaxID=9925 RepID=UPI0006B134EC|nr:PREDICTED: apolipoprotein C-II isoform X1 [Capra hircus]XP_017918054.1 PREDICTED: apolipoprotein C-II isoform X1 [Capra hircus]